MGLAASQARFLAITSRKMNCEFQSMEIAQQKLSTTRDLQRAAQQYQTSLSASKLVWETSDGDVMGLSYATMMTPSNFNEYLPYLVTDAKGKIVLPESTFNALKDAQIIDEKGNPLANIVDPSGSSTPNPNLYTLAGRNKFMDILGRTGMVEAASVVSGKTQGYQRLAGLGGEVEVGDIDVMNSTTFVNYLKNAKKQTIKTLTPGSTSSAAIFNENGCLLAPGRTSNQEIYYEVICKAGDTIPYQGEDENGNEISVTYNNILVPAGTKLNQDVSYDGTNYKAGETLPCDIKLTRKSGQIAPVDIAKAIPASKLVDASKAPMYPGFAIGFSQTADTIDKIGIADTDKYVSNSNDLKGDRDNPADGKWTIINGSTSLSATSNASQTITMGDILSGNYSFAIKASETDIVTYVKNLVNMIAKSFGYDSNGITNNGLNINDASQNALKWAIDFTLGQFNTKPSNGKGGVKTIDQAPELGTIGAEAAKYNQICKFNDGVYSVNISNLAQTFLSYYARCLDGENSGVKILNEKKDSTYVTENLNYNFILGSNVSHELDQLYGRFYNMYYNQICMYGVTTDKILQDNVTDPEYLSNAIKNGQLFISSLNTDGYFYQGAYTLNGHVGEVPDEDAIARAELEYEMTKSKLNYKEQILDLKTKNLDAEISALTTEMDTVKNLIGKNVEKVFTMFSS